MDFIKSNSQRNNSTLNNPQYGLWTVFTQSTFSLPLILMRRINFNNSNLSSRAIIRYFLFVTKCLQNEWHTTHFLSNKKQENFTCSTSACLCEHVSMQHLSQSRVVPKFSFMELPPGLFPSLLLHWGGDRPMSQSQDKLNQNYCIRMSGYHQS